jgi:3-oxoacyl-[acyl-carrier-protein] synthase II
MGRVVVTGLGTVCPSGNCTKDAWEAVVAGNSGVAPITLFDTSDHQIKIGAEVKNFDPKSFLQQKELRRYSRFIQFALSAAKEAIEESGFDWQSHSEDHGCCFGVGLGALARYEESTLQLKEFGERRVSPFFIPSVIPSMASGAVAQKYRLQGPSISPATACASGAHAIGEAYRYIRDGFAKVMVCGGAEAVISPLGVSGFTSLKALSSWQGDPTQASRPFDKDRDGFVIGEGAGALVLEDLESARKRGVKIYGEVVGYGLTCDAFHITAPADDHEGGQRCMKMALKSASLDSSDIGYINAHGTSTKLNDMYESTAIREIFGSHADKVAISSTKGVTGHCIGAAGAIEAIFTLLAMTNSTIPPTINYNTADPECPLDYTPNEARERRVRYALSNSFGFGGVNASLLFCNGSLV